MTAELDVVGIGNAIVDVITQTTDIFLADNRLDKNSMRLIDTAEAEALYAKMGQGMEMSGGSAGNTMAGIAMLGGKGAFIGKVAGDQLGQVYRHDIEAVGSRFVTTDLADGTPTGRCLILVTPDAARTMNTYLGAAVRLTPADIDEALIASAQVTYMEGYLWDPPAAKEAFLKAASAAHGAGRKVSLSLSDAFCVNRHLDSFRDLVAGHVDVLFANEAEITALYGTDFDAAVQAVRGQVAVAALTRSEKGAVIVTPEEIVTVPAAPVAKVVDTTGAGDLFASGFLYGYTRGRDMAACGAMGAICAAEIISHYGARSQADLRQLVAGI
ncbi:MULTISPECIES: adenosine kinase [Nitrospirillum]|uniref:Sugar/nucleoside kinase (Ribokinase family) n=1 Tax=Nitrospirillum amazonense TaxID=28077 RepID=A0A560FB99_9PROT|nr:adenosine kinase [Nitrospirillum amazonense]MEC4595023.1 adenosine kinase [Nitrospirillum amazonense]TWB18850.1 sugar/nucleoside kinase (ribokinase family) [Nitrospirillum amazonense]